MTVTFELARLRGWAPPGPVVTAEHTPLTASVATPWEAYRERQQADEESRAVIGELIRELIELIAGECRRKGLL